MSERIERAVIEDRDLALYKERLRYSLTLCFSPKETHTVWIWDQSGIRILLGLWGGWISWEQLKGCSVSVKRNADGRIIAIGKSPANPNSRSEWLAESEYFQFGSEVRPGP